MECKNHPEVAAVDRCAGCAEPFCSDCLVEVQGQKYCGSCKTMALRGAPPPIEEEATFPCAEAGEALTYAIVSLFCFGFILGPLSISKALKARQLIKEDPRLSGSGKVTAALIIGGMGLLLWVLMIIGRVTAAR